MTEKTSTGKARTGSATKVTLRQVKTPGNGESDLMMAMNGAALDAFARACRASFCGWAEVNSEVANFMAKRFRHDAELNAALARCESWEDAVTLQNDWAREAAEEYIEEASRLMEMTSKMASDQWKPVLQSAEETVAEFGEKAA